MSLGFTFNDYCEMYAAAVDACPDRLLNNRNLVATFALIDEFARFGPGLSAYSRAVEDQTGDVRAEGLALLISHAVQDIVELKAQELSALETYPPIKNRKST